MACTTMPLLWSISISESRYGCIPGDLPFHSGEGKFGWWAFMKFRYMKKGFSSLACRVIQSIAVFRISVSLVARSWYLKSRIFRAGCPALPSHSPMFTVLQAAMNFGSFRGQAGLRLGSS
jgi:hypothetical protein